MSWRSLARPDFKPLRHGSRAAVLAAALACQALAPNSQAQVPSAWPDKPIRIVLPFPPGGPSDIVIRLASEKMQAALKQTLPQKEALLKAANESAQKSQQTWSDANQRIALVGGPIFARDDRPFTPSAAPAGFKPVLIPREFFKIVAYRDSADNRIRDSLPVEHEGQSLEGFLNVGLSHEKPPRIVDASPEGFFPFEHQQLRHGEDLSSMTKCDRRQFQAEYGSRIAGRERESRGR